MKSFLLFAFSILSFSCLHAAGSLVSESPIAAYGTPVTIAISSNTITKVPSSQLSGRFGIYISNPSTNAGDVAGFFGNCSSTALASTIRPIVISTRSVVGMDYIPMREDVCLWLISIPTSAATQNIHYQEVKP